jgi:Flp pilus assembly protein TadB
MRQIGTTLLVSVFVLSLSQAAAAQQDLQQRVDQLSKRVEQLELKQRQPATEVRREAGGAVLFLFGAFCALWAQNTNRNPWLWFFLGLIFNVISVLVLLAKNSDDRRQARGEPPAAGSLIALAILAGLLILAAIGIIIYMLLAS